MTKLVDKLNAKLDLQRPQWVKRAQIREDFAKDPIQRTEALSQNIISDRVLQGNGHGRGIIAPQAKRGGF